MRERNLNKNYLVPAKTFLNHVKNKTTKSLGQLQPKERTKGKATPDRAKKNQCAGNARGATLFEIRVGAVGSFVKRTQSCKRSFLKNKGAQTQNRKTGKKSFPQESTNERNGSRGVKSGWAALRIGFQRTQLRSPPRPTQRHSHIFFPKYCLGIKVNR